MEHDFTFRSRTVILKRTEINNNKTHTTACLILLSNVKNGGDIVWGCTSIPFPIHPSEPELITIALGVKPT